MNVEIREIPAHIAYEKTFDIPDYYFFYDYETGSNLLQDLEDRMKADNPGVIVPPIPDDYNYFMHPADDDFVGPMHVVYHDMTLQRGKDAEGDYRFVDVPKITAAVTEHKGRYESMAKTCDALRKWIADNGYKITGQIRTSAINGPWDRDSRDDYLMEIQIPVEKI